MFLSKLASIAQHSSKGKVRMCYYLSQGIRVYPRETPNHCKHFSHVHEPSADTTYTSASFPTRNRRVDIGVCSAVSPLGLTSGDQVPRHVPARSRRCEQRGSDVVSRRRRVALLCKLVWDRLASAGVSWRGRSTREADKSALQDPTRSNHVRTFRTWLGPG